MLDTGPDFSERLFSDIDFSRGAIAAVSGGSDSTALLFLLKEHLDRLAPSAKLLAVTVNHDLRPDSAAEARGVARLCAEHGIEHRTLVWSGDKPSTGLPAAARDARYRLLAEAADQAGIRLVLTGHTADDQAETVLMREARGGDGRGLAGMAAATLHDWRNWIMRPLLGVRRASLRAWLRRRAIGWIDDPTNVDQRFERPRIRALLADDEGDPRFLRAIDRAGRAGAEREDLGRRTAKLIDATADSPTRGLIRLGADFAACPDREAAIYALRILLATSGGVSFLADEARSRSLFERLAAGRLCATLSRTVVDSRRAGVFLHREVRNLPGPVAAVDGMHWDGRRRITLSDKAADLVIAPLGPAAARQVTTTEGAAGPARAALAVEPMVLAGGERLDFAGDRAASRPVAIEPVVSPFARFMPLFDIAPAGAVARLVGAPPPPASPFGARGR